ncbi:MAG: type I 3-dehydroquinate dehydratase [Verrucomicrobiota bacterium]
MGTISTRRGLRYLTQKDVPADLLEVRVDCLRKDGMPVDEIESILDNRAHPTLLTLRTTVEGGSYSWKSTERILVFEQLLPKADAVDLEIRNMRFVKPILQMARDTNKAVILSAHSLERKLTYGKAERIIKSLRAYRVQAYKVAGLARTQDDLKVLVSLLMNYPQLRLALMATGPMAQISRTVLPALGSKMVYGYLDEPVAQDQPPIKELAKTLNAAGIFSDAS